MDQDTPEQTSFIQRLLRYDKWKTIIGLIVLLFAIYYNQNWVWGVLFLYWIIPGVIAGMVHFIEPIYIEDNPVLYWMITILWVLLSLYLIVEPFLLRMLEDSL